MFLASIDVRKLVKGIRQRKLVKGIR